MKDLSAKLRAAAWWLVPLAALGVLVGIEINWGQGLHKSPPAAEPIEPKPVVTALLPDFDIVGGLGARSETVNRTLFNPTRRPAPTLAAESAKSRIQRDQFTLTGTLVVDGKSTAFLRENNGGKSRRVIQGEQINGMTVTEVKPDRVKLTLGDEAEELTLKVALNPKPTALPAPPTAAPVQVPPAQPPGAQAPGPAGSAAQSPAQTLAARREAARAAAAAAAAASPPQAQPQVAPAGMPATGDSSWEAMAQRYRDRAAAPRK